MRVGSGLLAARFVTSVFDCGKVPADNRSAVAVAGRSNVGKSTLINCITEGRNIAKVSATPGKTQSLNFFLAEERFYLVDLPGYGYAKVSAETKKMWGKLVEEYLTGDPRLRGLVFLIDCRRQFEKDDLMLLDWVVNRPLPFLIVITKADKLTRSQLNTTVSGYRKLIFGKEDGQLTPFSVRSGLGRKEVIQWIRQIAV